MLRSDSGAHTPEPNSWSWCRRTVNGHAGAPHDCDHALMVAIPTELSHVTLAIYKKPLSRASNLEAFIL